MSLYQSTIPVPVTTSYVPLQSSVYQPIQNSVSVSSVSSLGLRQSIKGESRIEYHPYERSVIEYEEVRTTELVAKPKQVIDYYAVEYQTEYIPQVYQETYIEYVPQEYYQERVEYYPVERQVVYQPQQEVVYQPVVYQQPVQYTTVQVPQPVVYQSSVQYVQPQTFVETQPFAEMVQSRFV